MSIPALLTALLLTSAATNERPGCEQRCEKRYVPCAEPKEAGEMMCVRVVRECRQVCEPAGAKAKAKAKKTASKSL